MRRRFIHVMWGLGLLWHLTGCTQRNGPAVLCENREVLQTMRAYYPTVVDLSPDGNSLLVREKTNTQSGNEGLTVKSVATGTPKETLWTDEPPLRVRWRPDGRSIAYFLQDKQSNRRRLFIWDLDANVQKEEVIPTSYAQADVKWSPDGRRLAFSSNPDGLIVVEPSVRSVVVFAKKVQAFDWSDDCRQLAVVPSGTDEGIVLIDAKTGATTRKIDLPNQVELREVAWQSSRELLVRAYQQRTKTHTLVAIDLNTNRNEELHATTEEISGIAWLPRDTGFIWGRKNGERREILWRQRNSGAPRIVSGDGAFTMLRLSSDGGSVIASEVSPSASRLVRIDMRSGNVTVLASDESFRGSTVSHRATMIRAADGTPVPIWVSSLADSRARANAAVICVNGGTEIYLRSERWAETQTLLKYGVNVIHIANRKGNGASDVVSACRYAQKELGVPVARTVVLGGSTGASIALDAAVLDPTACGILAVYGVMGSESMPGQTERPPPPGLRLLAFHGGKDSIISPENARMILEQTLGRRTLSPPNGLWHVFENEDHSLHLETSQAAVVATILHVLGVTDCHRP